MRIYIACLASYNAGRLHGEWIDATADADEMQEEVNRILRASPCPNVMVDCPVCDGTGIDEDYTGDGSAHCRACNGNEKVPSAEEFAIHDFDGLPSTLGEYCGLQAVADYVEFVETCADHYGDGKELAKAVLENWHSVGDAKDALENFSGVYDSFRDYADEAADGMMPKDAPEMLTRYFDYESWARDLKLEMTVLDLPSGVAVFHG